MSHTTWVQFQQGAENLCCPSAILCGIEQVSALTHMLLPCCSLQFSLSWIFQQLSCSDRIFTLNTNIWLQLFCLKRLGHCVSLNCWKYWKLSGPHWGAFHPYPPDWSWVLPQKLCHWFCRQNILFSSGIAFGSNCQISSRGLNLDSNLNSASWPKKLWRFDLLLIYWINCQDFVFFLGLVKMQKLRQEKWLFQCSSPRLP